MNNCRLEFYFCNEQKFPYPNSSITNGIKPKASIFEYFPKIGADCKEFIFNNFDNFCMKMLREKMVTNLLSNQEDIVARLTSEHSDE